MHRKYFIILVILAVLCAILAFIYMWMEGHKETPLPPLTLAQPSSPFKSYISGVGIVEASSKNIFIGTPVNRIVDKVEVSVGQKVKEGQELFRLESRDLEADLLTKSLAYENALAKLQKLEALPRKEDVEASQANLKSAQLELAQAKELYEKVQGLQSSGALSQEEIDRRKLKYEQAQANVQLLQADFDKIKVGAWLPNLEIARLEVLQAKANVKRVEADIQRTIIRAPIDGTVLQVKINEGEFPPADSTRAPAMILGNIDTLHLRVSINQFDASYYNPAAPAVAYLQGNAQQKFPLEFAYLEPFFVTKQNLTNDITEKVDTRVLQAIYSFTGNNKRLFVGQQMDVFIKTDLP